jgi:hypothetical protein
MVTVNVDGLQQYQFTTHLLGSTRRLCHPSQKIQLNKNITSVHWKCYLSLYDLIKSLFVSQYLRYEKKWMVQIDSSLTKDNTIYIFLCSIRRVDKVLIVCFTLHMDIYLGLYLQQKTIYKVDFCEI